MGLKQTLRRILYPPKSHHSETSDTDPRETHYKWTGSDLYCTNHNAGFEWQEAYRNGENCPWCGDDVSEVMHD